jgi:hypothetical protein
MSVWAWIGVGLATAVGMSVLVGLAVANILAVIASEASALFEGDVWAGAAPSRAVRPLTRDPQARRIAASR